MIPQDNAPKTAFVLAAGLGTRMRPLTNDRSKALVEVGGRALIDHMLDRLRDAGATRFVVNVHAFADRLEAHLKARTDLDIVISDERDALLETGGGLKKAAPLLGTDPIWVANIDSVWIEDHESRALKELAAAWDGAAMDAILLLARMDRTTGFDGAGDFFMDGDNRLTFRNAAAAAPLNYMGVHITRPGIVGDVPEDAFSLSRIWRQSAPQGRLHGVLMEGDWMHVGDPAARDVAEARLKR
jgi:MurNAc alpha-1-phosphate uridylyltransferase